MTKASDAGWILILVVLLPVIILVFLGGWLKADVFGENGKKRRKG